MPVSTAARRYRWAGLLRDRNFRLLWSGETVSQAGSSLAVVLVPLLAVTALHASTFAVSALTAAAYAPWLLIGLPAGACVDRWPVRRLMVACDLVSAALFASLPVTAWLGVLGYGQLIAVVVLAGAADVFFGTAYQVCLPSLVAAGDLAEGNAKLLGSAEVAEIGGRAAAGALAEVAGAATAVALNALSFLVSAACLLRMTTASGRRGTPGPGAPGAAAPGAGTPAPGASGAQVSRTRTSVRADVASGAAFIARDPYLRAFTLFAAVSNVTYGGYTALTVLFLVRVAGLGPAGVGFLTAVTGAGGILGALIARPLSGRLGTARAMVFTFPVNVAGLLLPLTHTGPRVAFYIGGAFALGTRMLISNVITGAFRQSYCPPGMLGRVTAGTRFLSYTAMPAGAMIAGSLGTSLGIRNALWIFLGANALAGLLLCTPALLSSPDLPSRPPAPSGADAIAPRIPP